MGALPELVGVVQWAVAMPELIGETFKFACSKVEGYAWGIGVWS